MSDAVAIELSAFDAFLFDLDGVITRTAGLHALSLVMLACAVVLVAVTLPDRSLARTG